MARLDTRTSPVSDPLLETTSFLLAVTAPLTSPLMLTSRPDSEALTVAPSATSTLPVASTSPSTVPLTCRSPSMYSWPTSRSRGPSVTELAPAGAPWLGSCGLAARRLLKAPHPDVAVEARAIFDLKPLHRHVSAEPCGFAERELVARRQRPFDLAPNRHVGAFDRSLYRRARRDFDVARDVELAFGSPLHVDAAAVRELALQAVTRSEREPVRAARFRFSAVFLNVVRSGFVDRLLCVHKTNTPGEKWPDVRLE